MKAKENHINISNEKYKYMDSSFEENDDEINEINNFNLLEQLSMYVYIMNLYFFHIQLLSRLKNNSLMTSDFQWCLNLNV